MTESEFREKKKMRERQNQRENIKTPFLTFFHTERERELFEDLCDLL